ncbi:hypothetical protein D3C81_1028430 [compost metagenome]
MFEASARRHPSAAPNRNGSKGPVRNARARDPRRRGGSWEDDRSRFDFKGIHCARISEEGIDSGACIPGATVGSGTESEVRHTGRSAEERAFLAQRRRCRLHGHGQTRPA